MTLQLENKLSELDRLLDSAEAFLDSHGVPLPMQYKIKLALDEMFSNIVLYGYKPGDPPDTILVDMTLSGNTFSAILNDGGIPFNPLEKENANIDLPVEERPIGGLGIHLVKKISHDLHYERRENRNVFCFCIEVT
jgi:anti-sigma regulatory factor (Ser/Thr protein kinase)